MSLQDDGPRPGDRWIPWYFVGAFVLLFVIETVLVTTAVRTQTGVIADHAYERGLAYNTYLADQQAQQARGWKGAVAVRGSQLRFELKDRAGQPLTGAGVQVTIVRPVQDGMDFSLTLAESEPGAYISEVRFPQPGLWRIEVSATWQNQPYRMAQELSILP